MVLESAVLDNEIGRLLNPQLLSVPCDIERKVTNGNLAQAKQISCPSHALPYTPLVN